VNINDYLIDLAGFDWQAMLAGWAEILPETFTMWLVNRFGDAFIIAEDGSVLQARGVRCWFAPHDIQGGRKVHEQIDEAIRLYDKLLLILSDASMNSPWVKTEIANARAREQQEKRQMLFPVTLVPFDRIRPWKLFDADTGIDSAREIREYFIPDFSNWKDHGLYTAASERLVLDLKAQPGASADAQPAG
jgi:hypothetical protein